MRLQVTKERVFGLDLMRTVAIAFVLLGHCLWIYSDANGLIAAVFQVFAFLGVEIFFVLSGFLIGSILYRLFLEESFTAKTVLVFLKRRWFRTLPMYYLVLIINILIAFFYETWDSNLWRYFLFLQNVNAAMLPFFPESWSLSVEEYSYLVLPFIQLVFGFFFKPKNRSLFFLMVLAVLIVSGFLARIWFHTTTNNSDIVIWNANVKSVVIYRLDSIFIGVLCSWIAVNFKSYWTQYKRVFFAIGFFAIGFLFTGIGYFQILIPSHPLFWNVFYLPLVSISIAFFLPVLSQWKTFDSKLAQPITFISVISYSIYLLHYSIILQVMKKSFPINPQNTIALHLFTACYVVITFVLSYLTYRFFEKPIMNLRDKN
jgi:peptidoglycan/LPS O-acetylase OafA/YrhL